jgi:hypothetical protein
VRPSVSHSLSQLSASRALTRPAVSPSLTHSLTQPSVSRAVTHPAVSQAVSRSVGEERGEERSEEDELGGALPTRCGAGGPRARPAAGTSIIRNSAPLAPYTLNVPRALRRPEGGGLFLESEVALWRGLRRSRSVCQSFSRQSVRQSPSGQSVSHTLSGQSGSHSVIHFLRMQGRAWTGVPRS